MLIEFYEYAIPDIVTTQHSTCITAAENANI